MDQPTISAGICISGPRSFDPQFVTNTIGIRPTRIWRCKPEIARQNPKLNRVEWQYEVEDISQIEYSKALEVILDVFQEHAEKMTQLSNEHDLKISFHLVPRGEIRSFVPSIDSGLIQRMATFAGSLTIHSDRLD